MADRRAELERKKAKLEQMRASKRNKLEAGDADSGMRQLIVQEDLHAETDKILMDLGIPIPHETVAISRTSEPDKSIQEASLASAKRNYNLSTSQITQTNIPQKGIVQYSKETQTTKELSLKEDEDNDSIDVSIENSTPQPQRTRASTVGDLNEAEQPEPEKPVLRALTEEEKSEILMSSEFLTFFNRSSKIVERAITEKIDIFTDYTGLDDNDNKNLLEDGEQIKENRKFSDERWSKDRIITSMEWSYMFPELLMASYNRNETMVQEPNGVVLIWNLKYKKTTPEFSFNFQSPITSACFAKFHPNLVIGGTYSGHIVLWDNRVNKRTPIQRTPISSSTHTHPAFCLDIIGTQNAYNLVSASTDGKICFWNLEMLSQPQETIELQTRNTVAPLCFDFPVNDYNNFIVGCEDGNLYSARRHGNKPGINNIYEGHQAPVTRVDYHKALGPIDFSHCMLSSSYDWNIKLWNYKELNALHSFENADDYVTDVRWSPIHPALFASTDSTGRLDIWNLNNSVEVPSASTPSEGVAIRKCRWHSSGNIIAVGDIVGNITIHDISDSLAQPKADEWSRFSLTLQDLKVEQADSLKDPMTSSTPSLMKQMIAM